MGRSKSKFFQHMITIGAICTVLILTGCAVVAVGEAIREVLKIAGGF